jgi:hypothetical protein
MRGREAIARRRIETTRKRDNYSLSGGVGFNDFQRGGGQGERINLQLEEHEGDRFILQARRARVRFATP